MSTWTNLELALLCLAPFVIGYAVRDVIQSIRNMRQSGKPPMPRRPICPPLRQREHKAKTHLLN